MYLADIIKGEVYYLFLVPGKEAFETSYYADNLFCLFIASIVAALMTPFIPGAGPPPTTIARTSFIRNLLRQGLVEWHQEFFGNSS